MKEEEGNKRKKKKKIVATNIKIENRNKYNVRGGRK